MRTNHYLTFLIASGALLTPAVVNAQGGGRGAAMSQVATLHVGTTEILNVEPMENVPAIAGAPFTADATTEFTQLLSDGNRIERRFTTSLARDGRGRTRSEQDVAMLGPLTVLQKGMNWASGHGQAAAIAHNDPPRFTVITDPVDGVTYTLDERSKQARRSPSKMYTLQTLEVKKVVDKLELVGRAQGGGAPVVESLGTRQIEGVSADGTRTTTTIPAGQIGNLNPINLVTERWFSKELQMAVLITRRDPRSGETVYRLSSIVRAEPPPDLFTVPSDYRVVDLQKHQINMQIDGGEIKSLEIKKVEKARTRAQE
jgi:hypothetical protein